MRVLLVLLMLITTKSISQEITLKGIIVNEKEIPVPYVNIGIVDKAVGTVTNTKGEFTLYIDPLDNKSTLKVSCLGFESKIISIDALEKKEIITIQLLEKIEELDEVLVLPKKTKKHEVGSTKTETSRSVNFSLTNKKNQNLGAEIGKRFKLKKRTSNFLEEFSFYINKNTFESIKCRINIYAVKKNKPAHKINKENIIVNIAKHQKGWIDVDLTVYDIITNNDVIIAVEWIDYTGDKRSRLSLPITIPSLFATHYYKFGSQSQWKKYKNISSAMKLKFEN